MVGPAGAASRTLSYVLGGAVILLALAAATTPLDARSVLTWVTDLFGPVFIFLYISLVLAAVYAWTRMQNSRHGSPAAALWLETGLQAAAGLVTLALTFTLLGISLGIATLADQELTPATIQEVISALTQKFSLAFMTTVVGLPTAALFRMLLMLSHARAAARQSGGETFQGIQS